MHAYDKNNNFVTKITTKTNENKAILPNSLILPL